MEVGRLWVPIRYNIRVILGIIDNEKGLGS